MARKKSALRKGIILKPRAIESLQAELDRHHGELGDLRQVAADMVEEPREEERRRMWENFKAKWWK